MRVCRCHSCFFHNQREPPTYATSLVILHPLTPSVLSDIGGLSPADQCFLILSTPANREKIGGEIDSPPLVASIFVPHYELVTAETFSH
jgi:hypothetical protein